MKLINAMALVMVLVAAAGCEQATEQVAMVSTANAAQTEVRYWYSGANIPDSAPRGQVFEY
ncbi:MAG TPA: hypothetical protein VH600_04150 [Burkholderiales bacterium]|jgi:uncharacterized protein YccT (UPF0319 family)